MTLLEALKHFTIDIDGDDEPLIDIDYEANNFCKNQYKDLLHNLECIMDEDDYEKLNKIEADEKFLKALRDNELYELCEIGDCITNDLVCAAWLTSRDIKYDEIEEDEWEDMYVDTQIYEFVFNDFNYKFLYEGDIDMR